MSSYISKADFSAGYYEALSFVAIVLIISTVHQTKQLQRYFSGSKVPDLPDLPPRKDKYEIDLDMQGMSQSTVALSPVTNIHLAPTVYAHKFWNYVIHVIGVGDMSIGEIIIFCLYISINIIFLVIPFGGSGIPSTINIRAAYVALGNAAFIYPLATRNSIFLKLIGVPFERMIRFHRWVGRTIFFLLSFHASYQIQFYGSLNRILLAGDNVTLYGFLAYVSLFIIMIMSHSLFRRFFFEVFYWSHFFFIFFFIFGCLHQPQFIVFTIYGFVLYIIDRIIRFVSGFNSVEIVSIEALSANVSRIAFYFKPYYEAGQYMFVNFPNLNTPVSLITWHPVSFSSAPGVDDINHDTIHMKVQGSFTRRLFAKSQEGGMHNVHLKMKIDGPYGRPSLDFSSYRTVMLVAGGIGITPMISILKDLVDRQISNMPIMTQSIYFLWTVPDTDSYSWFGNELTEIQDRLTKRLPESKYQFDLKIFLTRSTTTPSSVFFQGRPNFMTMMKDLKEYHGSGDIAVGVCGPPSMLKEVRSAAVAESDETCLIK
ncbi:11125_t:CDS:2, partial [Cetraspora pellucida]